MGYRAAHSQAMSHGICDGSQPQAGTLIHGRMEKHGQEHGQEHGQANTCGPPRPAQHSSQTACCIPINRRD